MIHRTTFAIPAGNVQTILAVAALVASLSACNNANTSAPPAYAQSEATTPPAEASPAEIATPSTDRTALPAASARTESPVAVPPQAVDTNYLLGKFDPAARPDFVAVGKPYADRAGMSLRREAVESFQKMWAAAHREGISLKIISSTRTFAQQKAIWEGKWARFAAEAPEPEARARKILEYSSMPGASRHHWGTDFDLNDLNNSSFEAGGKHEKAYRWLAAHAHEYGFCQPYTAGRPHGYKEEKWHWSYTPLSKPLLEQYEKTVTDAAFAGFQGSETAAQIQVVKHYAMGINAACR